MIDLNVVQFSLVCPKRTIVSRWQTSAVGGTAALAHGSFFGSYRQPAVGGYNPECQRVTFMINDMLTRIDQHASVYINMGIRNEKAF